MMRTGKVLPGEHIYAQTVLLNKTPSESRTKVEYKFSDNTELAKQYENPWGYARHGKLMEDLDALAGTIAFKHCDDNNPQTRPLLIVTASVDKIEMKNKIKLNENVTLQGTVIWV